MDPNVTTFTRDELAESLDLPLTKTSNMERRNFYTMKWEEKDAEHGSITHHLAGLHCWTAPTSNNVVQHG